MEINGYSRTKQSKIYKKALSKYEEAVEKARDTRSSGHEEKPAQVNREGNIIKGEIIDLRFQEAKIRLEPGGQVIAARIDGKVPLYIGQTAEFVITGKSDEQIILRLVSPDNAPMHDIVYKALYSAGLATSEKNMAIVRELLKYQMPLDKETILKFIKLTAAYPNTDIKPLILLHKNNLPVNPVNIAQMEAYQKGMHRILGEINNLVENMGIYLEKIISDAYHENIIFTGISGDKSYTGNTPPADNAMNEDVKDGLKAKDAGIKPANHRGGDVPGGLMQADGKIHFRDIMNLYRELIYILKDGQETDTFYSLDTPIQSVLSDEELAKLKEALRPVPDLYDTGKEQADKAGYKGLGLATLGDYMNLLFDLQDKGYVKPLDENIFSSGLFEALTGIADSVSDSGKEKLLKLLRESNYPKRIAEAFHSRWTLSPDSLKEKIMDKKFFRRLYEDLEKLKDLGKLKGLTDIKLPEISNIRLSVNKLQDNLQFMRDLNELFLYLQLPLRLAGQDAHGDLYVFTRKGKAYDDKESINVLLHLDMANLGPVDIHMTMMDRKVNAVFYLEKTSEPLISAHLHELSDALQNKGYQFQVRTKISDSKPDFITDILHKDISGKIISTYSFDIRA